MKTLMAVVACLALAAAGVAAVDETLTYRVTIQSPVGGGPGGGGPMVVITLMRETANVQSDADHGGNPAMVTKTEKLRWWPTDLELSQLCQAR